MGWQPGRALALVLFVLVLAVLATRAVPTLGVGARAATAKGAPSPLDPTPGPGSATIYTVTNLYTTTLNVEHVFTDTTGFSYSFWSPVAPSSTNTYHVATMPQIPSPFNGVVSLYSSQAVNAQLAGYDNQGTVTPTPSPCPACSSTPTSTVMTSPTQTATRTITPTRTSTLIPSPTLTPLPVTGTITSTSTPDILLMPGHPTTITTVVSNATVVLDIPIESTPIARVVVATPSALPAITPVDSAYQSVLTIEIDAFDSNNNPVTILSAPLTISITLPVTSDVNPSLAVIYTVDARGNVQALATSDTLNDADKTFTATAQIGHLSPFVLFAPKSGTPVPLIYLPMAFDGPRR